MTTIIPMYSGSRPSLRLPGSAGPVGPGPYYSGKAALPPAKCATIFAVNQFSDCEFGSHIISILLMLSRVGACIEMRISCPI